MTTLSPDGHPTPEDLDGLLDGVGRPDVSAHAEECPQCTRQLGQLADVRRRLEQARLQIPLPVGLPEQIRQALADERRRSERGMPTRDGGVDDAPPVVDVWALTDQEREADPSADAAGPAPVVRLDSRRRRTLVLTAAAAVFAIGLGGAIVTGQFSGPSSVGSAAVDAGAAPQSTSYERSETGQAPAAVAPAAVSAATLAEAVRAVRAGRPSALTPADASACAGALGLGSSARQFAADWDGRPAFVLLADDNTVYVTSTDCADPDVLHETTVNP